ncbi:hypothetical protein CDD81_6449 [Ophiocordyceps australis]|uniref:Pre-rRNA-processing protein IPI3 n=1 Tax=Ophiocordyceps australis TaxID=1399860 RepID=A0A2C5YH39_9HYPO|nr:hypothetical protein CDD81_6449 [Ophiocordyceps australis]
MLSEELLASTCGPPIASNTAVSKDIGIYSHHVSPWAVKTTYKKSWVPPKGLAVGDTHVFAAQDQKAQLHVYSRAGGQQEALVSFDERIRCVALAANVVILGTAQGRLIVWETCTGRQVATSTCHLQPVTCLAVTPHHVLSASDDSNINVWSLAPMLDLAATDLSEPNLTLSNHRAPITDLVIGNSANPETLLCVSASKDKTCILWNYQTGQVLRILLLPSAPLCIALDPAGRALFAATQDLGLYLVELFADGPLLGARSVELPSTLVQVDVPLGMADDQTGPASCLAISHDGTCVYTGHQNGDILRWSLAGAAHAFKVTNLNASVTNLIFLPLLAAPKEYRAVTVVKPHQTQRQYTLTTQLLADLDTTPFLQELGFTGIHPRLLEPAMLSCGAPCEP